jgi:hypothetical protein
LPTTRIRRTARSKRTTGTVVHEVTLLAALCATTFMASSPVLAGPNAGGTLIVHDTGLGYTSTSSLYPSTPPIDCASTDNEMPAEIPPGAEGRIWKVYAAFVPGTSPRLKALAFGEAFQTELVVVSSGGLPDPAQGLEIAQNGWPDADGGGVAMTFNAAKTATISEVYWFGGYARDPTPGLWSTAPHPVQTSIFVDDAFPSHADVIAGFSSIGFGMPGTTVCPLPERACCFSDGVCQVLAPAACQAAGGNFDLSAGCAPNPCPQTGACCFPDESCHVLDAAACAQMGGLNQGYGIPCDPSPCFQARACCFPGAVCQLLGAVTCAREGGVDQGYGTSCDPNSCPSPGACCFVSGNCYLEDAALCSQAGGWHQGYGTYCWPDPCAGLTAACCSGDGNCHILNWHSCEQMGGSGLPGLQTCLPNPCPQPLGNCCYPDGSCQVMLHVDCTTGHWYMRDCDPNPCPQIGACCRPNGTCDLSLPAECADTWIPGSCDPNPCQTLEGACCLADGSCAIKLMVECELEFVPLGTCNAESIPCPNLVGACCFQDGSCRLLSRWQCDAAGGYSISVNECYPYICPMPNPIERTSWGRIKAAYR